MPRATPHNLAAFSREKERLQEAGRLKWYHWTIILLSFVLTVLAWNYTRTQNEEKTVARFERQAEQIVDLVTERMRKYEDVLRNGVAAIAAQSNGITHEEWRRYSETLDIDSKYPGINGIGLIFNVKPDVMERYLEKQREQRPDFNIHPAHDYGEYWPITYIEPVETNAAAVGLDVAHETNRITAAKKARDTATPQITAPIILVQDEKKTPGFLFYHPGYTKGAIDTLAQRQEKFLGLVYAPFIFENMMNGTLGAKQRLVGLKISDGPDILFNQGAGSQMQARTDANYSKDFEIPMNGREWTFNIWSTEAFDTASATNTPTAILLTGLMIDALLVAIFTLLARSSRNAIGFAEKLADEQEGIAERYENIMDKAADGIWTCGDDGRVTSFNKAAETMFGYKESEVMGESTALLMPSITQRFRGLISRNTGKIDPEFLDNVTEKNHEIGAVKKDGTPLTLEISVSQVEDQGQMIYNTIARDISRRKKSEEELRLTMEDLILSNEDLEKFAYIASHDLKSPLRGIDNLSKWLEEDLDAVMDDENRERVKKLRGRVARMESLLNDLLEYSRAGNNIKKTDALPAGQLLREIRELQNIPPGFEVNLAPELDTFNVARMPLEQIFHNLISNAIKHHDKNTGRIDISVDIQDKFYAFRVSDNGPGIDPDFHDKIFEMFQTLRPRDEVEGSGMGLALVKKIAYHHGGRIRIESEPGQGSTFVLRWPKTPRLRSRPKRQKEA